MHNFILDGEGVGQLWPSRLMPGTRQALAQAVFGLTFGSSALNESHAETGTAHRTTLEPFTMKAMTVDASVFTVAVLAGFMHHGFPSTILTPFSS